MKNTMAIKVEVSQGQFETKEVVCDTIQFTQVTNVAFQILQEIKGVSGRTCFTIYCALLSFRNNINNQCFPSVQALADRVGANIKTIKTSLDILEENNFIIINSGSRGTSNNYYFPREWFFQYFKDDYKQSNTKRKSNVVTSNKTKKQLLSQVQRLEIYNENLKKANKRKEEQLQVLKEHNNELKKTNLFLSQNNITQNSNAFIIESFDD